MANLTSVYNLSSQVLLMIERVDQDLQVDRREAIDALRQGAMKFLKADYFRTLESGQRFIDPHYIAKFTGIEVLKDSKKFERNYIELPAQYVALHDNQGIQRVWPVVEDEIEYIEMIPIPDGAEEIYRNLSTNNALVGVWTYSLTRNRIYFGRKDGETLITDDVLKVDVDIVVISPVDVGDEDPFPLPPEHHFDLMVSVIEVFTGNQQRVRQVITQEVVDEIRLQSEQLNRTTNEN